MDLSKMQSTRIFIVLITISFFVLGLKVLFERKLVDGHVYIATLNTSREVAVKFTSCLQ